MKIRSIGLKSGIIASVLMLVSHFAYADWKVAESSQIDYLSTKVLANSSGSVTENNVITGVSGTVSKAGKASILIDLTTLETSIGIRNERVQKFVFGIPDFPSTATIEASIPERLLSAESESVELPASLSFAGQTKAITLYLSIHNTGKHIHVVSKKPTIVKGSEFNLAQGFAKLTELAGLSYIPMDIPVSFDLTLLPK